MNPQHLKKLIIEGRSSGESARWRQIREMDYEITKNYPKQIIDSPLLVSEEESPRQRQNSDFLDLMMNGPADGIPYLVVKEKRKQKATLTDQLDIVMVDVL